MIANLTSIYMNGHLRKGSKRVEAKDFILPSHWKTEVEQDVDYIKKAFGIKK